MHTNHTSQKQHASERGTGDVPTDSISDAYWAPTSARLF